MIQYDTECAIIKCYEVNEEMWDVIVTDRETLSKQHHESITYDEMTELIADSE